MIIGAGFPKTPRGHTYTLVPHLAQGHLHHHFVPWYIERCFTVVCVYVCICVGRGKVQEQERDTTKDKPLTACFVRSAITAAHCFALASS